MRESRKKPLRAVIKDPAEKIQEFYDPLTNSSIKQTAKQREALSKLYSRSLFPPKSKEKSQLEEDRSIKFKNSQSRIVKSEQLNRSQISGQRLYKSQKLASQSDSFDQEKNYDFNNLFKATFRETAYFKNLLAYPFTKFNQKFRSKIEYLRKNTQQRGADREVAFDQSPIQYYNPQNKIFSVAKYFLGLSLSAKSKYNIYDALFFAKMSCYADPYCQFTWKRYIALQQERGNFLRACNLAKAGFLFTQHEDLAKLYLSNFQKSHEDMKEARGLLASLQNPEVFEKFIVPQCARMQLREKEAWKGIKILYQIVCNNQFKTYITSWVMVLARYLQNIGEAPTALNILQASFNKQNSKVQVYLLYLQIQMRLTSTLVDKDFEKVIQHIEVISSENRYRLFLEIAEYLFYQGRYAFFDYIKRSYQEAFRHCTVGAGRNKALRTIYYATCKMKGVPPLVNDTSDHTIFEKNRHNFTYGLPLIIHQFTEWKYYLHYGLIGNEQILLQAARKWPQAGRILAQWIQCLRLKKPALQMLKIWRQKINLVPKSGELWCEGGRIYAELEEFNNASMCFKNGMHFTPQYGDSFIEELRILLQAGRFMKVESLKRMFFVCEPFYGQVLSYIRLNISKTRKASLKEVWYQASENIKDGFKMQPKTNQKDHLFRKLTAYRPYNYAYIFKDSPRQRFKLFVSYEQMENKN